jgi:RNA polymerase sigma-70 factor (ECF subfamily)
MAAINSRALTARAGEEQPSAFAGLHAASHAEEFGLTLAEFVDILREVSSRYLPPHASEAEQVRFSNGLQLQELALARACAKGSEPAWDRFIEQYRPKLRGAARAITKEEARACELADSLYAELFGTRQTAEGSRISKLASYTGRGSLEGWLRTVLAQEYINQIRRERRLVSFDERIRDAAAPAMAGPVRPADARIEQAIDAALAELSAEERVIIASYYLDGRTLAEMARMLGAHESTICRRLAKITRALRKRISRMLRERGMSAGEAEEAMESDVRDLKVDLRSRLLKGNWDARSADSNRSSSEVGASGE